MGIKMRMNWDWDSLLLLHIIHNCSSINLFVLNCQLDAVTVNKNMDKNVYYQQDL